MPYNRDTNKLFAVYLKRTPVTLNVTWTLKEKKKKKEKILRFVERSRDSWVRRRIYMVS